MAAKCFGRAGDAYREKWATAAGLQKAAALVCGSDVKWGSLILREAAHEFDGIGRAESTAQCFIELKEYVRAGIWMISFFFFLFLPFLYFCLKLSLGRMKRTEGEFLKSFHFLYLVC